MIIVSLQGFYLLSIALQKAGIDPSEEYTIEKFKVIRHKED